MFETPLASAAVVVDPLLLLPQWCFVFGPCFVMQNSVAFLDLQTFC